MWIQQTVVKALPKVLTPMWVQREAALIDATYHEWISLISLIARRSGCGVEFSLLQDSQLNLLLGTCDMMMPAGFYDDYTTCRSSRRLVMVRVLALLWMHTRQIGFDTACRRLEFHETAVLEWVVV